MAAGRCSCSGEVRFDGLSKGYRRALWVVIALNALLFVVEMTAGVAAGSKALQADALDFLGDTATYAISLAVIGRSLRVRSTAALIKGASLSVMGVGVLGSTLYRVFVVGVPEAEVMGLVGVLALAANLASVLLLVKWKDGDANVRSVWLCSRNDAIGNIAVLVAASGVWATHTGWPDLIVAGLMASLFLWSSLHIIRQARSERMVAQPGAAE
jgi:Co/Zn/Cd efflux system component